MPKDAGYPAPEQPVGDEHQTQDGECPTGRTPGGFEYEEDQDGGRNRSQASGMPARSTTPR